MSGYAKRAMKGSLGMISSGGTLNAVFLNLVNSRSITGFNESSSFNLFFALLHSLSLAACCV